MMAAERDQETLPRSLHAGQRAAGWSCAAAYAIAAGDGAGRPRIPTTASGSSTYSGATDGEALIAVGSAVQIDDASNPRCAPHSPAREAAIRDRINSTVVSASLIAWRMAAWLPQC